MSPGTSFVRLIKSHADGSTYLVRGQLDGRQLWHYVKVDKLKISLFLKKVNGATFDITEYGTVLSSGWGDNPPKEI